VTFYRFPETLSPHRRATNVIESPFASVRLRTNAATRIKKITSGVCLVCVVVKGLEERWHRLKSAQLRASVLPSKKGE